MALRIVSLSGRPVTSGEGAPVEPARPDTEPGARGDPGVASVAGELGVGHGAKLLLHLFVEERTGRLVIDSGMAAGTVYFLAGEPAHCGITDDGAALRRRLGECGALATRDTARHPIATLARRASPGAVLEALRDETRECCQRLLAADGGAWSFFDDEACLDVVPLTAINPFGLTIEAQLRATPPSELMGLAERVAPLFPVPRGDFANTAARLKAFTGGVDLAEVVDGRRPASEVIAAVRLDPMMGALVLQTLADSGQLELSSSARRRSDRARRPAPRVGATAALAHTDSKLLSQLAAIPLGAAEILTLYLELKPEHDPDAVLGLVGSVGIAAIERAYQQRLAELDSRAIPAGPFRPYLLARAEELRAKVERAYRARTANRPRARTTSAYQILDRVGVGGMAEVFRGTRADDPGTFVAIKVILPELRDDPKFSEMFLDEARLARRIQHPNVVRVLTVGRGTDDLYLAMEYVDGLDLAELLHRGRAQNYAASVELVCRIIADASAGLHAAHSARDLSGAVSPILHRDVSPQNILVSRTGEVKLSDFGIAKAMGSPADEGGGVKGKVPYFAPELLLGEPASVRTDVYAMAMTMYAALGRLPFLRAERIETMRAILYEPLPPLSSLAPGVSPILDELLASAAARNPAERHASAQQLQLELEELLAQRPPVDVAGWARPLAGRRVEAGPPERPITKVSSSTGRTGVVATEPGTGGTAQDFSSDGGDSEEVDVDDL